MPTVSTTPTAGGIGHLSIAIRNASRTRDLNTIGIKTAEALDTLEILSRANGNAVATLQNTIATPTNIFTGITDLQGLAGSVGAPVDSGDGKLVSPITLTFTPPSDTTIAGCFFNLIWDDGLPPNQSIDIPASQLTSGTLKIPVPTPNAARNFTIYALTHDSLGRANPFNSTTTPQVHLSTGASGSGTLDLRKTILSSVAAYFSTASGAFAINPQGITTGLIDNFAITSAQLANAAVTATKIANLAVGTANIQAAAITTALIANAAITNALIANAAVLDANIGSCSVSKLTAGSATFSGTASFINGSNSVVIASTGIAITNGTLTLTLNGITTTINNATATITSRATGFTCTNGSITNYIDYLGGLSAATTTEFGSYGTTTSGGYVSLGASTHSVLLDVDVTNGPRLAFNGLQILKARQTGPGTPSFASFADVQTWCQNLYNALKLTTGHGLLT